MDENPKGLWISKGVEGPDGRTYFYIDPETIVQKASASDQKRTRSWIEYVAAGSGVIAILGITTYGLGLLALWIPIWWAFTDDAATAWHAASIVPQSRVAGLGIGQLIGWPTLWLLTYWFPYLGISIAGNLTSDYASQHLGRRAALIAGLAFYSLMGSIGFTLAAWGYFGWTVQTLVVTFVVAFMGFLTFFLVVLWYRATKQKGKAAPQDDAGDPPRSDAGQTTEVDPSKNAEDNKTARWWWVWLLVGIVPYYVFAAVDVMGSDPALPDVDITGVQDKHDMQGALLTHTDGFWYVFDDEGKNKGELTALRDDQVVTVKFSPEDKSSEGE